MGLALPASERSQRVDGCSPPDIPECFLIQRSEVTEKNSAVDYTQAKTGGWVPTASQWDNLRGGVKAVVYRASSMRAEGRRKGSVLHQGWIQFREKPT